MLCFLFVFRIISAFGLHKWEPFAEKIGRQQDEKKKKKKQHNFEMYKKVNGKGEIADHKK